jgi:mannose/fructose/N-acetylgalactosamine-specific phosphotransferase system component IIC
MKSSGLPSEAKNTLAWLALAALAVAGQFVPTEGLAIIARVMLLGYAIAFVYIALMLAVESGLLSRALAGLGRLWKVRHQKSEVRSQKSEVRSQRSEVRGQRSEVRERIKLKIDN